MSFPRYPDYKDSGVEWLGQVPAHWDVVPLKRLLDLQNGLDHKHIEVEEGYPVFGSGGAFASASQYLYNGKSVLLGRKGTIDRPLFVDGPFWTVDTMYWSRVREGTVPEFAYYAALAIPFSLYSTNTALPSMTKGALDSHFVLLPTWSEQLKIAEFLDCETAKIDALVAEQERLIALLKEKRQAVISHAVTKGLNPDAPTKDSGVEWLGLVPSHWRVERVAAWFHEVVQEGDETLPILSVSIHTGVSDAELSDDELDRKVTRSEDRTKYKRVEPGDLVYNMMRAWQGGFGSVTVTGMVSPAYVVARPAKDVSTVFVEYLLRTPAAIEQMRRYSKGVTDFRLRLYWEDFKNLRLALPPLQEALVIQEHIRAMELEFAALTDACESAIATLRERRSSLITAAVTGQIDVRGLASSESA